MNRKVFLQFVYLWFHLVSANYYILEKKEEEKHQEREDIPAYYPR
jgi:hypothetical protein